MFPYPEETQPLLAGSMSPRGHDYDLLRRGSDLLELALLAARGSAAASRLGLGGELDVEDIESLRSLADLLDASAKVIEFFGTEGQGGAPPTGALAARVDVAIDTVLQEASEPQDSTTLAARLRGLAMQIHDLTIRPDQSAAAALVDFFADLASSVLRETGHVGETTSTL